MTSVPADRNAISYGEAGRQAVEILERAEQRRRDSACFPCEFVVAEHWATLRKVYDEFAAAKSDAELLKSVRNFMVAVKPIADGGVS